MRELDHALDLVRVAVEAHVLRLEVLAGLLDVEDAEGRSRAAGLHLFGLAEPDRQVLRGCGHLAPSVLLELVDELETEHVAVPLDRALEVRDADRDGEVLAVVERGVRRHRSDLHLLAHRFLLSLLCPCPVLFLYYGYFCVNSGCPLPQPLVGPDSRRAAPAAREPLRDPGAHARAEPGVAAQDTRCPDRRRTRR